MRVLLTGSAGFIGSHTAEALLKRGDEVVGVDCLTSYYDRALKNRNLEPLLSHSRFQFENLNLAIDDIDPLISNVDAVIHLSAEPGVRASWGNFKTYVEQNVIATQRLLESCRDAQLRKIVYASSSSVYGRTDGSPSNEDDRPNPFSPYGVTKFSAEQLCKTYADNWGVPTVSLRYFTVFGSRQRPDMLINRVISAALTGSAFPLYGDGLQVRDFTHVRDVVSANLKALDSETDPGLVCNIGGGTAITVNGVIEMTSQMVGREVPIDHRNSLAGDVPSTAADTTSAAKNLGWYAEISFAEGIKEQIDWHLTTADLASLSCS